MKECQLQGFGLQGFGHLRGEPNWKFEKRAIFSKIAKRASEWRVLNFFLGKMLSSCHFDKMDVCWMFFLLALCWEIVIQNVDTPTCREKRPKLCVLKSTWIIILWNPQWSAKSPTWIWEATDLVKSYSNHIKSCHIISYNIISYFIFHISYFIYHISYPIIHSWGGQWWWSPHLQRRATPRWEAALATVFLGAQKKRYSYMSID